MNLNPRDELGWRIPRAGTLSRNIYRLTRQGMTPSAIAAALGTTPQRVRVLLCHLRHPEKTNARNARYVPKTARIEKLKQDTPYVNKLVRAMRIPRAEARRIAAEVGE